MLEKFYNIFIFSQKFYNIFIFSQKFYNIFIFSHMYLLLYPIFNFILSYNSKFTTINNYKKKYIVKNLIKSFGLFYLFINLIDIFLYQKINIIFDDNYINFMGAVYVGNDFIGILTIPNLPFSTKIHHFITCILYLYTIFFSIKNNDIGKLIVVYCIFSLIPYSVNTYLGLRYLYNDDNTIIKINKSIARYSYLIGCSMNWSIHILFLLSKIINYQINISHILYYIAIIPIIYDDLILLSWLKK